MQAYMRVVTRAHDLLRAHHHPSIMSLCPATQPLLTSPVPLRLGSFCACAWLVLTWLDAKWTPRPTVDHVTQVCKQRGLLHVRYRREEADRNDPTSHEAPKAPITAARSTHLLSPGPDTDQMPQAPRPAAPCPPKPLLLTLLYDPLPPQGPAQRVPPLHGLLRNQRLLCRGQVRADARGGEGLEGYREGLQGVQGLRL